MVLAAAVHRRRLSRVLEAPVLAYPPPLPRVVVHLEVRLHDHGEVGAVLLQHVLLVLRELDGHHVA